MKAKKSSLKEKKICKTENDLEPNTGQRITLDTIFEDPTEQTNEIINTTIDIMKIEYEDTAEKYHTKLVGLKTSRSNSVGNNALPDIEI